MKNYMIWGLLLLLLSSCEKSELKQYDAGRYINFTGKSDEVVNLSFKFYPKQEAVDYPVVVKLIGDPIDEDRTFAIRTKTEETTATASHYTLPRKMIMRANRVADTCFIRFTKTPELDTQTVELVVELEANENFGVGQMEYREMKFLISNKISQPAWWTADVSKLYLGGYSDRKYTLFIEQTLVSDLTDATSDEFRNYALVLKNYLQREKDAGRTVYEVSGAEMIVTVIGN